MSSPGRAAALTLLVATPLSLALSACADKPKSETAPASASASASAAPLTISAEPAAAGASAAMPVPASAPATSDFAATFLAAGAPQTTPGGIAYVDVVPGTGTELKTGGIGVLDFTGWLGDGKEFDSSKQRTGDFCFTIGGPTSVGFFNESLAGMKTGGTRRIRITPEQGYGAEGRGGLIPPNSTLLFEMTLREVRSPATRPDMAALALKTTPSGLKWADVKQGSGPEIKEGDTVKLHYSGFLEDGTKIDSSLDRCASIDVKNVGKAQVIPGWNEGLKGMRAGGRRVVVLPPSLAFGEAGRPPVIGPNATLTFELEALEILPPPPPPEPMSFPDTKALKLTTNPSGLQWSDVRVGQGKEIVAGGTAEIHYTGWLDNGTEFDSSVGRGEPYPVANVGRAAVIDGWNEGLQGMKEGGRRVLVIPASLAYGAAGRPPSIPADATLVFIVDASRVR